MTPWDQFKRAVVGRPMRILRREFDWVFEFGNGLALTVGTLWRFRDAGVIRLTSDDDGHQFALPAPLDVEKEVNRRLNRATIISIVDSDVMPDFLIRLSEGLAIDVIAQSSGYESWETSFDGVTVVGRAGD